MTELVGERTRRSKVYDLGGGKRRVVCSLANLHVPTDVAAMVRGEPVEWNEIDLSFRRQAATLQLSRGWYGLEIHDGIIGYSYVSKLTGASMQVKLMEIGGKPVDAPAQPRISGQEIWWDDVAPQLSFFLRVQTGRLEMYKKLFGPDASRDFLWEIDEDWPQAIEIKTDTAGHDNSDLLEPSREGAGPGLRCRRLQIGSEVLSETFPRADLRRRLVLETWTGNTLVRIANRGFEVSAEAVYPVLIDQDVSEAIAAVGDDGFQDATTGGAGGTWNNQYGSTGNHIIWKDDSGFSSYPGYRFQTVAVPNAATIDSATLTVNFSGGGSVTGTAVLSGNDVDDAPSWATGAGPTNMTSTSATVAFPNFGSGATGDKPMTVTAIVQEIVNRAGWASGNDMAFGCHAQTFGGTAGNTLYSYINDLDGGAGDIATLEIDYTAAGGGTPKGGRLTMLGVS